MPCPPRVDRPNALPAAHPYADPPTTDPDGKPIIGDVYPGSATKGYDFEYQSYRTKPNRNYLVRTHEKKIDVPVNWHDGKETLLEWIIPACPNEKYPCDWVWRLRTCKESTAGMTTLAYGGQNKDEKEEQVRAIKEQRPGEGETPPLTTALKGEIAGENGEEFMVNITVTSTCEESKLDGPRHFVYVVEKGDECVDFAFSRYNKDAKRKGVVVIWKSIDAPGCSVEILGGAGV